jgi:hypothetical protein
MEKIPTAEEFLDKVYPEFSDLSTGNIWTNIEILMIAFAKLHVTRALKAAAENAFPDSKYDVENSYPLDNIK